MRCQAPLGGHLRSFSRGLAIPSSRVSDNCERFLPSKSSWLPSKVRSLPAFTGEISVGPDPLLQVMPEADTGQQRMN